MRRTAARLSEQPPALAQTEVHVQAQSPYRRVGDLTIDLVRKQVVGGSQEFRLPKLSFDLLAALVEAAPEPVSIDSLRSQVWPGFVVTPETVVQRVKLLRGALGDDSRRPRYIEGVRGRGYRIVAQVSTLPRAELGRESPTEAAAESPTEAAAEPLAEAGAEPAAARSSAAPSRGVQDPRPRRAVPARAVAAIAALLLVVVAAGGFGLVRLVTLDTPAPRVAVLPFESLSPNPGDALLADGMQDELIDALAERTPSLGVIARTTMMTYRGQPKVAVSTVGRELSPPTSSRPRSGATPGHADDAGARRCQDRSHTYERDPTEMSSLRSEAAAEPRDAPASRQPADRRARWGSGHAQSRRLRSVSAGARGASGDVWHLRALLRHALARGFADHRDAADAGSGARPGFRGGVCAAHGRPDRGLSMECRCEATRSSGAFARIWPRRRGSCRAPRRRSRLGPITRHG